MSTTPIPASDRPSLDAESFPWFPADAFLPSSPKLDDHAAATAFDLELLFIDPSADGIHTTTSYTPLWAPRESPSGPLHGEVTPVGFKIRAFLGVDSTSGEPRMAVSLELPGRPPTRCVLPPRAKIPIHLD